MSVLIPSLTFGSKKSKLTASVVKGSRIRLDGRATFTPESITHLSTELTRLAKMVENGGGASPAPASKPRKTRKPRASAPKGEMTHEELLGADGSDA